MEEDSKLILDVSSEDIDEMFETASRRILAETRRQVNDEIRAKARVPELRPISLPNDMIVSKLESS